MASGALLLGLDVGTSGLKAVLLDENGRAVDEATASYPLRSPNPGWTEQDPEDWWAATCEALNALWSRGNAASSGAAIGLSGQMHSLVLVDASGSVVAPAILWSDQRTAAECDEITSHIGATRLLAQIGR